MKTNPKVLFLCKKRQDARGISVGLVNSASFVSNVLNEHGIESKVVMVVDGNGIDKEVYHYKPTHVVIEAIWVTPKKMEELLPRYPKIRWIVRVHSKAAFIAHEGMAMEWLTAYVNKICTKFKHFYISANNKEFNDELTEIMGRECLFLPNIYQPKDVISPLEKANNPEILNIGCFGAIRPMKNQLVQGIAVIRFGNRIGKKIRFHVNADRLEQQGETVIRNLRAIFKHTNHELVEHGWMPHKEFLELISQMDIGMQVSLSESFNIVSADMVIEDIPIVVSDEIDWLPWICRVDPKDSEAIISKLTWVYRFRNFGITKFNRCALRRNNAINTKGWLKQLAAL